MNSEKTEKLSIGLFKFANDESGELISVPSELALQGYLGYDHDESDYARIQIPVSDDPDELARFSALWQTIYKSSNTSVFTEIFDYGEDDGIPYYVSKFPHGEPLSVYLENSPPWPGKMAARLICKFIASLRFQDDLPINEYALTYDSLWIEKTIYGPRLLIGDVDLYHSHSASSYNAGMMLSVFKELTKEQAPDPAIAQMFKKLAQGPMSLGAVERGLKSFALSGDLRDLDWTPQSEPTPFLDQCIAKVDYVAKDKLIERKDPIPKKSKLDGLIGFRPLYRPAIELDPEAPTVHVPKSVIVKWAAAAVFLLLAGIAFFTSPGKAAVSHISGLISGFSYEPELVIPVKEDSFTSQVEPVDYGFDFGYARIGESPIPVSLNGSLLDSEGTINGSFQAFDDSINTYTVSQ